MRQHLSRYYKVIEQNSLPIPHTIVRYPEISDYKGQGHLATPLRRPTIPALIASFRFSRSVLCAIAHEGRVRVQPIHGCALSLTQHHRRRIVLALALLDSAWARSITRWAGAAGASARQLHQPIYERSMKGR